MANALYQKAYEAAMKTRPMNLLAGNIKAVLIDTGAYTLDLVNHEFLSDIPSGARIGTPVALSNKTIASRVFNADPISITGLSSPPTCEAIAIFEDTGTASTSPLLVWIDTATGLPTAAGVTQANIAWDTGANKIFKL